MIQTRRASVMSIRPPLHESYGHSRTSQRYGRAHSHRPNGLWVDTPEKQTDCFQTSARYTHCLDCLHGLTLWGVVA
jgi:hypothetical protein